MRSGDVLVDTGIQQRLLPMLRLRPAAWAHARPGVVRTDGSGNISSIETGMPIPFSQTSASNRPSVVATAGRFAIRSTATQQLATSFTSYFPQLGPASLVVMWWSRVNEGPDARIIDIFSNEFMRVGYNTTPQAIGSYGGITQSVTIANDRPYVASIRADGGNAATFRVGDSSQAITSGYSSEDASAQFGGNCDYFEIAVFTRELSAHETLLAEGIIAWSSGFPEALSNNHPFRNRPPTLGD